MYKKYEFNSCMQNIDEIQLATAPSRRTITYGDYRPGSDKAHVSLAEPHLGRSGKVLPERKNAGISWRIMRESCWRIMRE